MSTNRRNKTQRLTTLNQQQQSEKNAGVNIRKEKTNSIDLTKGQRRNVSQYFDN
jgi:hypothetical protein